MINECSNALDNSLQELRGLQLDMTEKVCLILPTGYRFYHI